MSELPLPVFSFCCIYIWEKRYAQLTLHGCVSCADLVKIGECCLAVVISLGQTIYLAVFPQNLFSKVLCDPVYLLYFSGAGHHVGDDGGARQAPAGLFHVPLGGHDEDHHVGHLPRADRSLLPHQRTGKKEKDNHDSHSIN